jgi:hypothetical protein
MQELIDYLESIPAEAIDSNEVALLVASCWDELECDNPEGMRINKLYNRIENVSWNPPILRFEIERHGAMVGGGSTRAEMQFWEINVETRTLEGGETGSYRQKFPMQPRLDVKPIAKEIAELIISKQEDNRLKWNTDGSVRVIIGDVIPSKGIFKTTLEGRRKRFHTEIESLLTTGGWHKVRANVYAQTVE